MIFRVYCDESCEKNSNVCKGIQVNKQQTWKY